MKKYMDESLLPSARIQDLVYSDDIKVYLDYLDGVCDGISTKDPKKWVYGNLGIEHLVEADDEKERDYFTEALRSMCEGVEGAVIRDDRRCSVCSNPPDEDGCIEHGKGCYTQSEDGGGYSFV